jgi:hypothetical protein
MLQGLEKACWRSVEALLGDWGDGSCAEQGESCMRAMREETHAEEPQIM